MAANVHCQLISVNCHLIADSVRATDNQPMIDTPQPDSYETFVEWLNAFCDYHGTQRAAAKAANVSPQAMTKWREGKNVSAQNLKALAAAASADYAKLLLLFNKQPTKSAPIAPSKLSTTTELGAITGRKWEKLYEPARSQMLSLIETLLALQSPSHREYGLKQQELAKQREKPSPKRTEKT
jgi:transcriptional regulator with XRE-family HTH domain